MPEIIPAILAQDFEDVKKKIKLVEAYTKWVQLDVGDGKFTAVKTWASAEELKRISTPLNLEVHLMVSEPENVIDGWISSGVKRILVHIESTEKLTEIIDKIKNAGLEAGIVLNLQTPMDVLNGLPFDFVPQSAGLRSGNSSLLPEQGQQPASKAIDIIQLMGISEIGCYGHPFDERVIPKIMALREKYGDAVKISVDGGINVETAKKASAAGADILVAGSAVFGSEDVKKAIEDLRNSI